MKCLNCNKEHDGAYGNGKFCCLHCSRQYAGKLTKNHGKGIKRPRKTYFCEICKKEYLGEDAFRKHKKIHDHRAKGNWKCKICNSIFRTRRELQKHHLSHPEFKPHGGGCQYKDNRKCKFCDYEKYTTKAGMSLHEKYCFKNINRVDYIPHKQTTETKLKLSAAAKKNNFGGWHTSKSICYNNKLFDSSYEVKVAKSLDENSIEYIVKPKCFNYILNGENHKYYPDLYLPKYNIYLDPKNDYLINNINPRFGISDPEKIKLVEEQNNVKILILDKNNLTWEKIKILID